jgi:putative acetyltransferase
MTPLDIRPAGGPTDIEEAKRLFEEYSRWIGIDLSFQNFAEELQNLPGDYAPPAGVLLLARSGRAVAGCIAVRRIDESTCEMKRLYVRDAFRGKGAGVALANAAVRWARQAGYARMLLDTLPSMGSAHRLYGRLGFKEIEPYRFNPVPGARYMAINLI